MIFIAKNARIFFAFFFCLLLSATLGSSFLYAQKIVVLGDSITEGYGVSKSEAFPALIEKQLRTEQFPNVSVVNAGFSGSTSASGPSRAEWLLKSNPDVLVLELGANDGLRGQDVKTMKENLRKVIRLATQKNVKVLLVGIELPTNYGKTYSDAFKRSFSDLAREEKVVYFPFDQEFSKDKTLFLPDGLHPNAKGHQKIAGLLSTSLKNILSTNNNNKKKK